MIPADVASRLRLVVSDQPVLTQPIEAAQKLTDVLSNLVPGQRVMANILALLPNGTYRAVVAQRDVTLALPFSAKPGDTLELEVTESDGKLTLAFVANRSEGNGEVGTDSVATSLSQTGKLIGDLIGNVDDPSKKANPAPLNGNLPLVDDFPMRGADLAPVLKEALTKSGVFYEAHQARWVAGELSTDTLRQEPQGKLPAIIASELAEISTPIRSEANTQSARPEVAAQAGTIPQDVKPIVQQQLDALATQNYAWQGQIWPGQQMRWEISENQERQAQEAADVSSSWQTRLRLALPSLGGIDAALRLQPGGDVELALTATSPSSEARLRERIGDLRDQFEASGLRLVQAQVQHGEITE